MEVRVVVTTNQTYPNITTNDSPLSLGGASMVPGKKILLAGQTNPVQNGVHIIFLDTSTGTIMWTVTRRNVERLDDGDIVICQEGTHAGSQWRLDTDGDIIPGVSVQNWSKMVSSDLDARVAVLEGMGPVSDALLLHKAGAEPVTGVKDFQAQPTGILATSIANTPAGNIAATTLQAAINELDVEKALFVHTHAQADVTNLVADLALKAPLASPALTGVPVAPTAVPLTNNTQLATTAYTDAAVAAVINAAPGALDTLDELAAALGDDANFSASTAISLATKLVKTANLSDLTDASVARTNLGLGTLATQNGTFSGVSSGTNTGDQTLYNQVIEDEGVPVTQRSNVTYVGAGVTVSDVGGKTQVSIPGSVGGDSISVNGVAATDANFVTTAATSTIASVTPILTTGPSPDEINITVGEASATAAGTVTAVAQTLGGVKTVLVDDAVTNVATDVIIVDHSSSGTPAVGFGTGISFKGESATVLSRIMAGIKAVWTDASDVTRSAALHLDTVLNGVSSTKVTVLPSGYVGINKTVPVAHLHIKSAANGWNLFGEASDGSQLYGFYQQSTGDGELELMAGSGAVWAEMSKEINTHTYFNPDGNFGINISVPLEKFHLVGNARVSGQVQAETSLRVGGATGAAVTKFLTATATLDFPNTIAGTVADLNVTTTGAALGDVVSIGVPNVSVAATSTFFAWVSAADTVTIRHSPNGATADPISGTFRVMVMKF